LVWVNFRKKLCKFYTFFCCTPTKKQKIKQTKTDLTLSSSNTGQHYHHLTLSVDLLDEQDEHFLIVLSQIKSVSKST